MQRQYELDRAFHEVRRNFPFEGYVNSACYHQLKAIVSALSEFLPTSQGHTLLDVGSGPLDKTAIFQELGFQTSAVDDLGDPWHRLESNTDLILQFAQNQGINFYKQEDGDYSIPFEKNYFDVVTSIAVIEHLHDTPRLVLNAMGEHLKPKGLLVVVMPNSVNLRKRLSVMLGKTNYNPVDELYYSIGGYRGHVREYTLAETKYICELSGFKVLHARHFEHLAHSKLSSPFRSIYMFVSALIPAFRSGVMVIAEKPESWEPKNESVDSYYRAIGTATPFSRQKS